MILDLGPYISLRTKFEALTLELASNVKSLVLALALKIGFLVHSCRVVNIAVLIVLPIVSAISASIGDTFHMQCRYFSRNFRQYSIPILLLSVALVNSVNNTTKAWTIVLHLN